MKKTHSAWTLCLAIALGTTVLLQPGSTTPTQAQEPAASGGSDSERSWPPDDESYARPVVADDLSPHGTAALGVQTQGVNPAVAELGALGSAEPGIFIVDVVVNNTNPNLTNTDTAGDSETSIAVNPANPDEIVISGFSGSWGNNAPIYHSLDGGLTWTRQLSVPVPPGWPMACPCDWTWDYGRNNQLSATILGISPTTSPFPCSFTMAPMCTTDVVTGTTTNPAMSGSFLYFDPAGPPVQAQETNINVPASLGNADQPWVLVNPDPITPVQDNVYVAWDDFNNTDGTDGADMRVAVSYGANPPNFTVDQQIGNSTSGINPGLRLAKDPRTGFLWGLYQRRTGAGAGDSQNIDYMLNRTTNGGASWSLNGNAFGIMVANADSTQPTPKFGSVNALLGGVHHAAVDPNTGDLYYVYGDRDSGTGNDRLSIRRVSGDGAGGVVVGPASFVTGQVEAAIPQVAVTTNGVVGVFYYTFDGFSSDDFPIFTAHLALSDDGGASFVTHDLVTFLSVATDNGNARQRVLGDYMQMQTVGNCFYGSFNANGAPFGRPMANHDPIFFKTCVGPQVQVPGSVAFGDTCVGDTSLRDLDVCSTGTENVVVEAVNSSDPQFAVTDPSTGFPVTVSPDFCFPFEASFTPDDAGPQAGTLTVVSDDPANPSIGVSATGNGTIPDVRLTGSGDFASVCSEDGPADRTLSVCNTGSCNLEVSGAEIDCADFTVQSSPFPASISPDSCLDLVVRFTPTSVGPKMCTLTVHTDDPDTPDPTLDLTGTTPAASIDVPGDLAFRPTVIQSVDACESAQPFPVSNTGRCDLEITDFSIGTNPDEYSLSALPSFPIILEPGAVAGSGDLRAVFAPDGIDRDVQGQVSVTYVTDPFTMATATETRDLCGEGVRTGARVLVTHGGVPLPEVKSIRLHRINANRNDKVHLDTIDNARNVPLHAETPAAPCTPFQYHREYGTVSNPVQLLPGSYEVTVQTRIDGKIRRRTVGFDVSSCGFNPTIIVDF